MKSLHFIVVLGLLIISVAPSQSMATVNIFACEPEWEAVAKEIGHDKIRVKTATTANTDPHHIRARPSLIAAMRHSDIVFCSGSELEVGWLPILLEKAKESVQPGQVGYLMAADYVTRLEVPVELDRSHGDVHPGGNPHVHLNPHNILIIAEELSQRLSLIDTTNAAFYKQQMLHFRKEWQQAIHAWEIKASRLKNMPIVVHHKNWSYLVDWLGLHEVTTLEPKPGIPPSISHLETLLVTLQSTPVKAIIRAPYEDETPSEWLSEKTAVAMLELPFTIGGNNKVKDLYGLFDNTIESLLEVHK